MKRPITGRTMSFQHKTWPAWDGYPDQTNSSFSTYVETQREDANQQQHSPVWESAILFPDIPNVTSDNQRSCDVLDVSCAPSDTSDMSSVLSNTRNDEPSQETTFLYKELSFLYEKWSDEDGLKSQTRNSEGKSQPGDETMSSGNWFHSQTIYKGNEFHLQTPPPPSPMHESSDNSMVVAFNQLTLTPNKNQSEFREKLTSLSTSPAQTSLPYQSISPNVSPSSDRYCTFCKKNGETREYYTSHIIKDNKGQVICPILRDFVCPMCCATGSSAHTLSYCPLLKGKERRVYSIYNRPNNTITNKAKKSLF